MKVVIVVGKEYIDALLIGIGGKDYMRTSAIMLNYTLNVNIKTFVDLKKFCIPFKLMEYRKKSESMWFIYYFT